MGSDIGSDREDKLMELSVPVVTAEGRSGSVKGSEGAPCTTAAERGEGGSGRVKGSEGAS